MISQETQIGILASLGHTINHHDRKSAIKSLQRFQGQEETGDWCQLTEFIATSRRCPCADVQMGDKERRQDRQRCWDANSLKVWHDMGSAFTKEQFLEGARLWSAHIDMRFVWVDRKEDANVFAHRRRIDGRGNTLAWAMLPWHNAKPGDFVSEQRYDSFDFTGSENPVPTGGHEMGHTLGISHIADRSNLMFFAMTGVEELGNQDIAEGVARYGKATNRPPVVPPVDEEPIEGIINSVYFSTEEIGPEVGTVVQGGDSFTAYGRE